MFKLVRKYALRLVALVIVVIVLIVGVFFAFVEFTPFDTSKLDAKSPPTEVYAKDGSLYLSIGGQGTTNLTYNQIPENLRNALVATEDHSFWTSSSINIRGVLRSLVVDLMSRSYAQGGSTIEMQLAKIVYLNDKKTLFRKVRQVVLGVQIDRYYTKQEILAMYLNKVFLGENSIGVEQAAMRYFNIDLAKDPGALTLPQAALLAGLPQAPSAYDPLMHPQAALARRNVVLDNLVKYGYITAAQADAAKKAPLGVGKQAYQISGDAWDTHPLVTSFLLDYASRQGIRPEEILQGGLKIYTTLDPTVQGAIDKVFWSDNYNGDFPSYSKTALLQGAALFVDPKTGGILGGAGTRKAGFVPGGYDRIYSADSPGSSIKPIMEYAPAIESGKFTPDSVLNNTPHDFGGGYVPQNYDRANAPGQVSLAYALQTSQNVASVSLLQQIGVSTGVSFAENDGIPVKSEVRNQLGIAIGGGLAVSPYIMAQAYEAFDNQGVQMQEHLINRVVNMQGDAIYTYQNAAKRIMSADTAATMTQLLMNVVEQGTGVTAQVPGWQVAGKTGTVQYSAGQSDVHSNWLRRVWFDGYTANMVGSVYLGYDDTNDQNHLIDFPDPVANCAKVFSDIVTLAEANQQPIPLNTSVASAQQQQQQPTVPIANLTAKYDQGSNSVTLNWSSNSPNQNLTFVVDRTDMGPSGVNTGTVTLLGRTSSVSFVDPSVQPGEEYSYTVQPTDAQTGKSVGGSLSVTVVIPGSSNAQGDGGTNQDGSVPTAPGADGNATNDTTNGIDLGGLLNSIDGNGADQNVTGTGNDASGTGQPNQSTENHNTEHHRRK